MTGFFEKRNKEKVPSECLFKYIRGSEVLAVSQRIWMINTRVTQKISSVCEYCRCSAAVTKVRIRAEFVDSVARHGRNLQTFEQCRKVV